MESENKKPGAKKIVDSPEVLLSWFEEYVKEVKGNPFKVPDWVGKDAIEVSRKKEKPLTMVGFENYCFRKGYIKDLKDYFANDDNRYNEYQDTCQVIRSIIQQDQIEGGMAGIYNHTLTARLNGLVEKAETKITANVNSANLDNLSAEELNKLLDIQNKLNVKG